MKLAFIVQRYGKEILGGSETLARQLAERLSRRHEITVLTTTAKDYITWKNEYPPGEDKIRGVRVIRFPVVGERNLEEFNRFSEEVYKGPTTREMELEWLERQGPVAPELIEYLKKEHERFDLLVFFTYLYYPTYYGLQVAPEKSVLLPTAHDEPPLRLGIFREMFQLPSSFLFNTEAEELLVLERFPVHKKMRETIGIGMELLEQPDIHTFRRKHDIPGKYLLYAGRIDAGKGLEELFRYFEFYKEEHPASGNLQLILIGRLSMKLPESPSIRYIGFVDEGDKLSAMAGAVAVVQPSRMESLSIVTLEAFSVGTPIIANAASRVLVDHCRKANAGLYYADFEEFEEVLTLLLEDRNLARSLGRNGQTYIKDHYGWNRLLSKYELVFRSSARPAKEPRSARFRPPAPVTRPAGTEEEREVVAVAQAENDSDAIETGDVPLLDSESADVPAEEPSDGEREPVEALSDEAYAEGAEIDDQREPFDELAGEDASFDEEEELEEESPLALEEEEALEEETEEGIEAGIEEDEELADSYDRAPSGDSGLEEEREQASREEPPPPAPSEDDTGLPEFYRPRPRPAGREKED